MTVRGYQGVDCKPCSIEFSDYKRIRADAPAKGESRLYVGTYLKPGLFWFGSDTIMEGPEGFAPDGEIKRVLRNRNGYVYLDEPFKRTWHGPAVIPLGVPILEDVQLIGGKGSIHAGLVNNLLIKDWEVSSYTEARAISVQSCRNVRIQNVSVSNPSQTGPGQGYGIQLQRCVGVEATAISGVCARHLVTAFGSAQCAVRNSQSERSVGTAFDLHFACEDCLFEDCDSGLSDFSCGNRWSWGNHNITVRRMTNTKCAWVHGTSSLDVFDSAFQGPLGLSQNAWGPPRRVRAFNSSFRAFSTAKWLHLQGGDDFDLTQVEFDIATLVNSGPQVAAV